MKGFESFFLILYRERIMRGIVPKNALMGLSLSPELNPSTSPDDELLPEWFMLKTAARL